MPMVNECLWHGILKDNRVFACQKMTKKKQNQYLLRRVKKAFSATFVYNMRVSRHFGSQRLDIAQKSF